MKKVAIILTSLLIAFVSGCQDHNLEPEPEEVMAWRAGGPAGDTGLSIAVDKSGNTYVTGAFTSTATFGSTTLTSNGISDIFIVKYNNKGEALWAQRAGGPNTNTSSVDDRGHAIVVDDLGNVYVTGFFSGTATFGSLSLTSMGGRDIFISKYNSSGEVQWVRSAGGTGDDQGLDIAVDKSGNLYTTGSFNDTATFGSTSFTSRGSGDIFIAKYNSNGNVLWAQQAGGAGQDIGNSIAVDEFGNVYITGAYRGDATFGTTTLPFPTSRISDIFIAKYSSSGEVLWAQGGGSGGGNGIAVDGNGNVYVVGTVYLNIASSEIRLGKYNMNGDEEWSKFIGKQGGDDTGTEIAVDKNGSIYLIGYITGQVGIAPLPLNSAVLHNFNLVHQGGNDILVTKLDNNGNLLWAKGAGGTGDDTGEGIAVDEHGTVYTTGSFQETATFGTTTLTSAGHFDIFVATYKE